MMSWRPLIGLSVLLFSTNSLLHRVLMRDDESSPYAQATVFTGLVGLFSLTILLFRGGFKSHVSLEELPLFLLITLLTALGMILTFKGIKLVEASEHTILLTSSRLWSIIGAMVFLHESMSAQRFIGAALILAGVVAAQWRRRGLSLGVGSLYVLLAAFFLGSGEILCFSVLRQFEALSFMVYASTMIAITLILARPQVIREFSFYFEPRRAVIILVTSLSDTLANLLAFVAYQVGRNALQIGPLGATQTIVTVMLALVILKERDRVLQKILGAAVAVVGSILLL